MSTILKSALLSGAPMALVGLAIATPAYGQQQSPVDAAQPQPSDVAAAEPAGATSQPADQVVEIIVTAQRRSERLQDVPLAITAITPETVTQSGLRSMVDIKLMTPSVDFTSSTGFAMLFIRGIGVPFVTPGLEPPVAIYLDNTYIPRVAGLNSLMDLVDPGTIEIIRGPQGTLYGRNATGGVVRISSATPTDRFEGRVMAEYGRFDHQQVDGMLNVPVSDELSLRFAGRYRKEDGYVKNPDGIAIPEGDNYTARARFKWTPSDAIDIVGGVEWQHSEANGFNDQLGLGAPTCYVCQSTGEQPGGFYDTRANILEPYRNRAFRGDLRVNYEAGDFVLTSTTTYFNNDSVQFADNDFTSVPAFFFQVYGAGGKTFGQEFQVSYDDRGPFSFIFALNYLDDKSFIDIALEGAAYQFAVDAVGAFPRNNNRLDTTSAAALLEGVYELSDRIKVTLGGRYTYDKREQHVTNSAGFQLFGAPASFSASDSFRAFTPRFVLAWDNGPTNLYYSYTRGFKAGGFVSPSPFPGRAVKPEKVFNHEVGIKQSALGGRLSTSLSAFYYKNKGLQQQIIDASSGGTITENAGSAEGYGAEFEVNFRPFEGLVLGGSAGYLHAEYERYENAAVVCFDPTGSLNLNFPGATLYPCRRDLSGTMVPHAPKWTASLNASYTFSIGSWSANLAGIAQYRSSSLFWPGAGGDLGFDKQDGYAVANFSGYVSPPGDNLRLGFYVDNAFDEKYATIRTTSQPWGAAYNAARPITYGARVEYKF